MEVYDKPNLTKEIIGGVVGGLILLALMTAGLAKVTNEQYEIMQLFDFTAIFTLSLYLYACCLSVLSFLHICLSISVGLLQESVPTETRGGRS